MIFTFNARSIARHAAAAAMVTLLVCAAAEAPAAGQRLNPAEHYPRMIRMDELITNAAAMARDELDTHKTPPPYLQSLLADGRLSIGLGIGTDDLGAVSVPLKQEQRACRMKWTVCGRPVEIDARLILTHEEFRRGLAECEVVFVTSHSRFGAGPVFKLDGKARPFLMQTTPGYEVVMPDEEVCGYQGKVKRRFYNKDRKKGYTVFEPDGSDLDNATPLHGYQLLVLSTCTSLKHFHDDIAAFRSSYPTSVIFTTKPACVDTGMTVFMRMLAAMFQARPVSEVVTAMNREYKKVAERHVRAKAKGWKVVDEMYRLGIDAVP